MTEHFEIEDYVLDNDGLFDVYEIHLTGLIPGSDTSTYTSRIAEFASKELAIEYAKFKGSCTVTQVTRDYHSDFHEEAVLDLETGLPESWNDPETWEILF